MNDLHNLIIYIEKHCFLDSWYNIKTLNFPLGHSLRFGNFTDEMLKELVNRGILEFDKNKYRLRENFMIM